MSSTVLCTFTRHDFADFAVGRLMREVTGIQNIRHQKQKAKKTAKAPSCGMMLSSWGTAENRMTASAPETPPLYGNEPVTIKVICDSASKDRVVALLRAMQGYSIITAG